MALILAVDLSQDFPVGQDSAELMSAAVDGRESNEVLPSVAQGARPRGRHVF